MKSLQSPNLRRRRRIRIIARSFLFVLICAILFGVPIFLARTYRLQINTITVSGNAVISSSAVESVAKTVISGNYLYIFPKSNIFLYPKKSLENSLYSTFPRIEQLEISTIVPHIIQISLKEREAKALWCTGDSLSNCFLLDADGFIFDKSPSFTQNVYFVYRGGVEGDPIGKQFLPKEIFQKAELFVERIRSVGLDPVSLSYMQNDESSVELLKGGSILISLQDDIEKNISNLESVLLDPGLSLVKNGVLTVSSIDLRYGNKVILKKKGD